MGAIVYASASPRADTYHFDRKCTFLVYGQELNDWDCGCDWGCGHRGPQIHRIDRLSDNKATIDLRLWPCRYCVPAHLRRFPPSETFGHEPFTCDDGTGRVLCARCVRKKRPFSWDVDGEKITGFTFLPVRWPCTSAIVLGLAPRPTAN
jgi:hypothetical protein